MSKKLEVGQKAPVFELPRTGNKKINLKDFQGKQNVVLAFHPLNFTGV